MAEKTINKKSIDNLEKAISFAYESVNSANDIDAVKYIETNYPKMAAEFKKICSEQYELFCQKQANYGPSNISVGTDLKTKDDIKLSLTGLWFRMNDKIQRLKNLVVLGKADTVGESIKDSFQDVSNYGIIAKLVSRGKWAK